MVRKAFAKLEATTEEQSGLRGMIFAKIKHALAKHAFQEETVVYPALMKADPEGAARHLNDDHLDIKMHLAEGLRADKSSPEFMRGMMELKTILDRHMREEEDEIFPRFADRMSEEETTKLTLLMHREGLRLA
jgi:hemerythrin superfamily protein